MGGTGDSQGSHLHFELYLKRRRVNPDPYFTKNLPGTPTPAGTTPTIEGNPVKTIYKTTTGSRNLPLWALGDDEALDPLNAGWVETRDTNVVSGQWAPRYGSFVGMSEAAFVAMRTKFRAPRTTTPNPAPAPVLGDAVAEALIAVSEAIEKQTIALGVKIDALPAEIDRYTDGRKNAS